MKDGRIKVPDNLQPRIDRLVKDYAKRLGETEDRARRAVELGLLQRGIEAFEQEARGQ
jgi:hypothetical protein